MQPQSQRLQAFAPIVGEQPQVLILGTMPSVRSLSDVQYYAHPRNAFWPILCRVLGMDINLDYAARCEMLRTHQIALWDVLCSCVRPGSADSAITHARPNDFENFFAQYPSIKTIVFNGQGAQRLWRRHVKLNLSIRTMCLPATSPAYTMPFDEKLKGWQPLLALLHL